MHTRKINELIDQAWKLIEKKDIEKALRILNEVKLASNHPKYNAWVTGRGLCYQASGALQLALMLFQSVDNNLRVADCLFAMKEYAQACQAYARYMRDVQQQSAPILYLNYGNALLHCDEYKKALDVFKQVKDWPQHSGALLGIARAYTGLCQYDQAQKIFNQLFTFKNMGSKHVRAVALRYCQFLLKSGDPKAEHYLQTLMRKYPDSKIFKALYLSRYAFPEGRVACYQAVSKRDRFFAKDKVDHNARLESLDLAVSQPRKP